MTDQTFQLAAIVLYFAGMLAIGWFAFRQTKDLDDYMLAGRGLKPGTAALSAGASDMSGWLLLGLPGAIYVSGLVEAWIAIGLTIGAWLNWKFVAPRLRSYTHVSNNSITIPSFFENRLKDTSRLLRVVSGVIILVFFTFYVSSGMVAGGVFFENSFGSTFLAGMLIVAGVTLLYTLFGGFLGATLTDVAQGLLMLAALIVVPVVALSATGGIGATIDSIREVNPDLLSLTAGGSVLGVISAAAWGLGYVGQPHILVRFMALRSPQDAKAGRRIGIGWMILTALGALATALIGIAYFQQNPDVTLDNPETVFLLLSQILFHPFVAGLVLAAVLAAIMSTISSQLIVCSSALVEDLYKIVGKKDATPKQLVMLGRLGVLLVALVAGLIALNRDSTILELVGFAWAGFGAAFGPVVLLSLYWKKLSTWGALAGMVTGAVVVFVWGNSELSATMYEIVPGFLASLLVTVVVSLATYKPSMEIEAEFDEAVAQAHHNYTKPEAAPAAV
ncbi:sodium/proline symporter PutP [Cryobacterium zongtaii]|uniref:Sodium/proline symporter n=1 Tax=Cryobacterium zongtaii TaxID=1259217 RepID=A0A2S3ZNZ3_9MICO|nr:MULTISPECIES: sodium/proline symporter PutP [Cryobacterium]POH70802.1 sodium/proline symporter PutP [Cryobacterium zongtaii]TFC50359.1 sodium/proline symporter PutP [Cryobacterium sp. TMB3-1-2]TFC60809.1 sodium/proline symporter PutP [Cryobacterium sp. TMB1-7]TFC71906.1 sodium/proline symporter PutP [Cryobacterium sp. TMB3-15]TFC78499.1 sodium/proline symporter PutP [Cryobacterium sp. TMB3-10]